MHTFLRSEFQGGYRSLQDANFDGIKRFRSAKKELAGKENEIFDIEIVVNAKNRMEYTSAAYISK